MMDQGQLKKLGRKNRRDAAIVILLLAVSIPVAILLAIWLNPGYTREPFRDTKYALGDIPVTVTAYGKDKGKVEQAVREAFNEITRIDAMTNRFNADSELAQMNQRAYQEPVPVSDDLWNMISTSRDYYGLSQGTYDITLGALSDVWGFGENKRTVPPTPEEVAQARATTGIQHLILDPAAKTVRFDIPGLIVDLGGVAKGYAVDLAAAKLRTDGVAAALVDAISSSQTMGDKPGGQNGWQIAVTNPRDPNSWLAEISVPGSTTINTSGDFQQYYDYQGVRYHHILDPATGAPARQSISLTILGAANSTQAEILTKTVFILGYPRGMEVLQQMGVNAILVDNTGAVHSSPGLQGHINLHTDHVPPEPPAVPAG